MPNFLIYSRANLFLSFNPTYKMRHQVHILEYVYALTFSFILRSVFVRHLQIPNLLRKQVFRRWCIRKSDKRIICFQYTGIYKMIVRGDANRIRNHFFCKYCIKIPDIIWANLRKIINKQLLGRRQTEQQLIN